MSAPKREHLLQIAETVFSREGFKGVSVDRILKQAGEKMTLYKGFESKEALICETLRRRAERLASHIEHTVESAGSKPVDRLASCFDAMESWSKRADFNGCYFVNALGEFATEDSCVGLIVRDYKYRFLSRLEDLCVACGAQEPRSLARSLLMLIDGATITHMTLGDINSYARAKSAALHLISVNLCNSD